jgi:hypothetical protein
MKTIMHGLSDPCMCSLNSEKHKIEYEQKKGILLISLIFYSKLIVDVVRYIVLQLGRREIHNNILSSIYF